MNKKFCDRCGNDITEEKHVFQSLKFMTPSGGIAHEYVRDYCLKCWEEIKKIQEQKS